MKAVDTNILVRLAARDDPEQLRLARELFLAGDVLILPTVILEAAWVLRTRYRLGRAELVERLTAVCGQSGATLVSAAAVSAALAAYARAGDFADLLHSALAAELGAASMVTFDRSFVTADALTIEVLGSGTAPT